MKRKILSLILIFCCIFSLSSCSLRNVRDDYEKVERELTSRGYEVRHMRENDIVNVLYANHPDGDEIYVIYCSSLRVAKSIYKYANKYRKVEKAGLKMNIKTLEYLLYKAEEVDSAEKGKYYEEYIDKKEELDAYRKYGCGRYGSIVWYGTRQAVIDING